MQWGKLLKLIGLSKATSLEKIEQAVAKDCMPSIFANNIAPEIRQGLTEYVSIFAKFTGGKSQALKAQADEVIYKLNLCDDVKIKAEAEELLSSLAGKNEKEGWRIITKAENLLDSVNTAEEKYCTLFSSRTPIGTYKNYDMSTRKANKRLFKIYAEKGEKDKIEELHQDIERGFSEPRKIARFEERHGDKIPNDILRNENRFNSLREFMELNPNDKETATYLWEKYFLSHQDTGTQKILKEIYDEFGTRICFVDKNLDRAKLYYVREEFRMWNKACNGEAKFPGLLDIRKSYKIISESLGGECNQSQNKIIVADCNVTPSGFRYNALRHEMGHLNDSKLIEFNSKSSIPNEKKEIISQELKNGGSGHIDYALTNMNELKAVACEANMEALSQEFKDEIVREGLHPGVVNLRPVSYAKARLYNKFKGPKNEKLIDDLEKAFGGTIPNNIVHTFDSGDIKYVKSILKNLKEGEILTIDLFKQKLIDKRKLGKSMKQTKLEEKFDEIHLEIKEIQEELNKISHTLTRTYEAQ